MPNPTIVPRLAVYSAQSTRAAALSELTKASAAHKRCHRDDKVGPQRAISHRTSVPLASMASTSSARTMSVSGISRPLSVVPVDSVD